MPYNPDVDTLAPITGDEDAGELEEGAVQAREREFSTNTIHSVVQQTYSRLKGCLEEIFDNNRERESRIAAIAIFITEENPFDLEEERLYYQAIIQYREEIATQLHDSILESLKIRREVS